MASYLILTGRILSHISLRCYYGVIFSDFFLCCCHAPEILYFYLITKRAPRLFGNGKHLLTLCPGHFISGVTSPEYRWIARLYYRCRNFITNRHTSSLQSAYLRLSHHRWRKREKKSAVWQWLMRRQPKKARVFRGQAVLSNDAQ